jgi:hypothetical protein
VSDRRRKKAIDKVMNAVKVIVPGIPMLAVVRSTIWLGSANLMEQRPLAYPGRGRN